MVEKLRIILGAPGEAEMPLLADLGARDDCEIVAVVDPTGCALGASIAEIMGLPVLPSFASLNLAAEKVPPLFILPDGLGSLVASLAAGATALGLSTLRADELRALLFSRRLQPQSRKRQVRRAHGLREMERESAELQAALAGLEDALAGDAILRRLLGMCTRATRASGGSIMLFDEASRELYIAYAVGLSEGTLHGTRVKLGEGIAGRVARTRQSELLSGSCAGSERRRDRPDIASAICTPLVSGERLLGVLNISTQRGEPPLDETARAALDGLAVRLGRILDGVQQIQQERTSRIFDLTEQQLRRLVAGKPDLPDMLTAWCGSLAITAEALRVSLVVACEDGGLLLCESDGAGEGRHWYEPLQNPAWLEILSSGLPLVARQADRTGIAMPPLTVFYLPIGRDPVLAGLAVHFAHSRGAHAFHALAGEMVFLLERLLTDQLGQRRQALRADRLGRLSAVLTELAMHTGTPGQLAEKICEAARQLTGARFVAAVVDCDSTPPRLAGGNIPESTPWLGELPRLLRKAAADGWRITTLESVTAPLSVLAVVSRPGQAAPGLVILGKQRLHDLDGQVFTPQDAELVLPLAAGIGQYLPVPPAEAPDLLALPSPHQLSRPEEDSANAAHDEVQLLADLRRELDRCDRYHNVCGLVLLRPDLPASNVLDLLRAAARRIETFLRNSDRCYALDHGCLAVLVPEDIQHLDRLLQRLCGGLRELAADPSLAIATARLAYPVTKGTAEELLARLRQRLDG